MNGLLNGGAPGATTLHARRLVGEMALRLFAVEDLMPRSRGDRCTGQNHTPRLRHPVGARRALRAPASRRPGTVAAGVGADVPRPPSQRRRAHLPDVVVCTRSIAAEALGARAEEERGVGHSSHHRGRRGPCAASNGDGRGPFAAPQLQGRTCLACLKPYPFPPMYSGVR